ncbi:MAG: hypothetical protein M3472_04225, partial [Chloroflexota bacterium]|nr:hypothetical protein [Chloroflexota bacterium]
MRMPRLQMIGVGTGILLGVLIALLLVSAFMRPGPAPAAGGPAGSEPTGATSAPSEAGSSPAASLPPTAKPSSPGSLADLRVSTAGWRTDFTRSNVDFGEIIG